MKIYLAARFGRREQLKLLRDELTRLGHIVTSSWLDSTCAPSDRGPTACLPEERIATAIQDLADIDAAHCVVSFTEEPNTTLSGRGGRHSEFGYALANGKRLVIIGHRENLFHFLPEVEFFESHWGWLRRLLAEFPVYVELPRAVEVAPEKLQEGDVFMEDCNPSHYLVLGQDLEVADFVAMRARSYETGGVCSFGGQCDYLFLVGRVKEPKSEPAS